jgi:hypothetical protein
MTPAQERIIKAAIAFKEVSVNLGFRRLDSMPSAIIHELCDAVRELPGPTGQFPDGKLDASDQGEVKLLVSNNDTQVRLDFGTPVAWFAMPKPDALTFAFTILQHCGVTIQHQIQQDLAPGPPA